MKEEWKAVVGFTGYEVSNKGRVRSYRQCRSGHPPKIRKPIKTRFNPKKTTQVYYWEIGLIDPAGKKKVKYVHHLVLEAFVGPRPTEDHVAAHCNGNSLDPRLSNLRWATRSENEMDKHKHGTIKRGEKNNSKITEHQARQIKYDPFWKRGSAAKWAAAFGISTCTVYKIRRGIKWSYV